MNVVVWELDLSVSFNPISPVHRLLVFFVTGELCVNPHPHLPKALMSLGRGMEPGGQLKTPQSLLC